MLARKPSLTPPCFVVKQCFLKPASSSDSINEEDEKIRLSEIIRSINEIFGTDFDETDRILVAQMTSNMLSDEDLMNKVKNNVKLNSKSIEITVFLKL